ncbi:hypothetical protein M413DRAFT_442551 [Hebeloma cylindrosporum]|uniref:Uncharacterized protein n=1 Tax=Hebeloma cylindrosporum TaxID=76867 RepID=A0A0C3C6T0_HEBCY|nr:hypothetical protein M413DRAFT_442551 [Hebeloma cylindrosporum h7]
MRGILKTWSLTPCLCAGGSPTSAGSVSTASSTSGGSGSNSAAALSPHAESSMALALLLALISGFFSRASAWRTSYLRSATWIMKQEYS